MSREIDRRIFLGALAGLGVAIGGGCRLLGQSARLAQTGGGGGRSLYKVVTDFGAVGDGRTNDTAAIDAAINAAAASTDNRTVYFPRGTYMHNGNWQITDSDIRLLGEGGANSVVKQRTVGTNQNFIEIRPNADRVTIEGLTINANKTAFPAFDGAALAPICCDDCRIRNCRIIDHVNWGIRAIGDMGIGAPVNRLSITDCYVDCTGITCGVWLEQDQRDFQIAGCQFVQADQASAIGCMNNNAASTISRGTIANNTFTIVGTSHDSPCAITAIPTVGGASRPQDLTITGNTITAAGTWFGFTSLEIENSTFTENTMTGTGSAYWGMEIVDSQGSTFSNNAINGNGVVQPLMLVNNTSDCVFDGNILENPATTGYGACIYIFGDSQWTHHGDRNVISNNKFVQPGQVHGVTIASGDAVASADDNRVTGNHFHGDSSSRGIHLDRVAGSLSRTLITDNDFDTLEYALTFNDDVDTTIRRNRATGIGKQIFLFQSDAAGAGLQLADNDWDNNTVNTTNNA